MCTQTLPGKLRDRAIFDVGKARILPRSTVHKCKVVVLSAQALHHPFRANHSLTYQLSSHSYILPPMFRVTAPFYPSTALKFNMD
jgi:hypothetical protein